MTTPNTPKKSQILNRQSSIANLTAFTLIEMIIVIAIISALLGLLYGPLERAQKFSRRTITYSELKTIEAAFKQYKAHYHAWPEGLVSSPPLQDSNGDKGFIIDERIAYLLQGVVTQTEADQFNPEMIPFLELSRRSPTTRAPVNPFKPVKNTQTERVYKVLFDTNGDRQITITDADTGYSTNGIIADVAVWTVIPAIRQVDESGSPRNAGDVVFGSWDSFSITK